jgi:outer membrane protein assembly factor BamE (lipoprotein component of BamABCDE complex)
VGSKRKEERREKYFMRKLFIVFISILAVIGTSFFLYHSKTIANRQNHIFCDLLKPGMSKEDVLDILGKFGDIEYDISTFGDDTIEIYMKYVDPSIVGQKTFILTFDNGNYRYAGVIRGFWKGIDNTDAVCD